MEIEEWLKEGGHVIFVPVLPAAKMGMIDLDNLKRAIPNHDYIASQDNFCFQYGVALNFLKKNDKTFEMSEELKIRLSDIIDQINQMTVENDFSTPLGIVSKSFLILHDILVEYYLGYVKNVVDRLIPSCSSFYSDFLEQFKND